MHSNRAFLNPDIFQPTKYTVPPTRVAKELPPKPWQLPKFELFVQSFIFLITALNPQRYNWLELIDKNRTRINVARDNRFRCTRCRAVHVRAELRTPNAMRFFFSALAMFTSPFLLTTPTSLAFACEGFLHL